jgi:hypothetical protein
MSDFDGMHCTMTPQGCIHAGPHACGNLIPPHEHHQIFNPHEGYGVSVHVYGHELKSCRRFTEEADGRYRADVVPLGYDGDLSQPDPAMAPLWLAAAPPSESDK